MTTSTPTHSPEANPASAVGQRHDMYAGIHKALRLFMTQTLCRMGSTDAADSAELSSSLDQLERLLTSCELHLKDENDFVHPALERAQAGNSARIAAEHVQHQQEIAKLRDLAALVQHSPEATRAGALSRLYLSLSLFVAENLEHMHIEETVHNPLLWAAYSDAELIAIHNALVASVPPAAMMDLLHWFLPAINASERAGMLMGMRQGMPPPAFQGVLDIAEKTLSQADHARLMRALGLPA